MKGKLQDQNALITGASRGIGRAIALRFAEEGANLFLCARQWGRLQELAQELKELGGEVVVHAADVSSPESVQGMVGRALKEIGKIDILVNNAGAYKASRFIDYSLEDFDRVLKVNLYGTFLVTQAVLPAMIQQKKGKIINIASTAGKWGSQNQSAYNASKHGIVGLTRCLALEMGPYNINVNAICPAIVETDMVEPFVEQHAKILGISPEEMLKNLINKRPKKKFLQPREVAHLALYLASEESDGMTAQSLALCGDYIMV